MPGSKKIKKTVNSRLFVRSNFERGAVPVCERDGNRSGAVGAARLLSAALGALGAGNRHGVALFIMATDVNCDLLPR